MLNSCPGFLLPLIANRIIWRRSGVQVKLFMRAFVGRASLKSYPVLALCRQSCMESILKLVKTLYICVSVCAVRKIKWWQKLDCLCVRALAPTNPLVPYILQSINAYKQFDDDDGQCSTKGQVSERYCCLKRNHLFRLFLKTVQTLCNEGCMKVLFK